MPDKTKLKGKADIHIHTIFSDGLMSPEALVEYVVHETDLDVIAITDHDTIAGSLIAQAYVQKFADRFRPIEVITGAEITSLDGDILALFIEEDIPPGLSAIETVNLIHDQNGLAVAAHPFSHAPMLLRIDGMKGVGKQIRTVPFDGVEVRNGTPTEFFSNRIARRVNQRGAKCSETGGSDGHYLPSVGKSFTYFQGNTAQDLRHSIENGLTTAGGHIYSPFMIFGLIRELLSRRLPVHQLPESRRAWMMQNVSNES